MDWNLEQHWHFFCWKRSCSRAFLVKFITYTKINDSLLSKVLTFVGYKSTKRGSSVMAYICWSIIEVAAGPSTIPNRKKGRSNMAYIQNINSFISVKICYFQSSHGRIIFTEPCCRRICRWFHLMSVFSQFMLHVLFAHNRAWIFKKKETLIYRALSHVLSPLTLTEMAISLLK